MQTCLKLVLLFSFCLIPLTNVRGMSSLYKSKDDEAYWKYLLHLNQKNKSKIDSEHFFLYKNSDWNYDREFEATINALKEENKVAGWFSYPIQCVFVERFRFLLDRGYIKNPPIVDCSMFNDWKNGLNADSLTLVFSSYYPNNPSSMFGHTLLRINQKNKKSDLLDYSVAFSAIPNASDIGIVFALKGLFGGYRGLIELTKYYSKVSEYNNFESRDLFEYDLKIAPEGIERFVNHLWEIYQTSYADYYFADENCSSFLAELLQVALYQDENIARPYRFYYLPADLIKRVDEVPNLVSKINYRPSLKKELESSYKKIDDKVLDSKIEQMESTEVKFDSYELDYLINFYEYKKNRNKMYLSEADRLKLHKFLVLRSKNIKVNPTSSFFRPDDPKSSHLPQTLKYFFSNGRLDSGLGIGYRAGFHDFYDNDQGLRKFSKFNFFSFDLAYFNKEKKLELSEATLVDISSFHPYTFYDPQFSWNAKVNFDRKNLASPIGLNIVFDGGVSKEFNHTSSIISFLIGLSGRRDHEYRFGPIAEAIYIQNIADQFKVFGQFSFDIDLEKQWNKSYQFHQEIGVSYNAKVNSVLSLKYKRESKIKSFKRDFDSLKLAHEIHF